MLRSPPVPTSNWAGNVSYRAATVQRPESWDQLRRIVAGSDRLRVRGNGHSFGPIAEATGDLLLLDRLPRSIEVDADAHTVAVTGGVSYQELGEALRETGLALPNLASLPHITVAGACATATHGSGTGLRCLASSVSAVQLVRSDGELASLSGAEHPEIFAGAVVNLGALGVIRRLTLDLVPDYRIAQSVRVAVPLDQVETELDPILDAAYSVSIFTDWHSGNATVFLKRRTDQPVGGWSGGKPADRPIAPVPDHSADGCTTQFGLAGSWYDRLPHFGGELPEVGQELQSEYFLPRPVAAAGLAALRSIGDRLRPVLQISEVRSVQADELWLSPAYRRESVTVHFTWEHDLAAVRPVIAAVEQQLAPFRARPHWAKLTAAEPSEIGQHYQRMEDFRLLAASMDPHGSFRNPFLAELIGG